MIVIQFLLAILLFELAVLSVLVLSLYFERIFFRHKRKKREADRAIFSQIIIDCLHNKKEWVPTHTSAFHRETLLLTLEAYDHRLKGDEWSVLRKKITKASLLPYARKWSNAFFWEKRNFCARCFSLCPLQEDQKKIIKLMNDRVFLVRSNAAIALTRLGQKKGIKKILEHMIVERGYGRFFYRDILLHEGALETFELIEEIASEEQGHHSLHIECLNILSGKAMTLTHPFLQWDLASEDAKIRYAAVKVFARNPQKESAQILMQCMEDPVAEVRAEAAYGLGYFASKESIAKLESALSDNVWNVRLQAAWSLKRMGVMGVAILKQQSLQVNKSAFETVQYALEFDW